MLLTRREGVAERYSETDVFHTHVSAVGDLALDLAGLFSIETKHQAGKQMHFSEHTLQRNDNEEWNHLAHIKLSSDMPLLII